MSWPHIDPVAEWRRCITERDSAFDEVDRLRQSLANLSANFENTVELNVKLRRDRDDLARRLAGLVEAAERLTQAFEWRTEPTGVAVDVERHNAMTGLVAAVYELRAFTAEAAVAPSAGRREESEDG